MDTVRVSSVGCRVSVRVSVSVSISLLWLI